MLANQSNIAAASRLALRCRRRGTRPAAWSQQSTACAARSSTSASAPSSHDPPDASTSSASSSSSSRTSPLPAAPPEANTSAARSSALASAAQASSSASARHARASPVPRSLSHAPVSALSSSVVPATTTRLYAFDDGVSAPADDEHSTPTLSSRDRRRSRAARFGTAGGDRLVKMPEALEERAEALLEDADRAALRSDLARLRLYRESGSAGPESSAWPRRPERHAALHLVSSSPSRYAVLRSVLARTATTLAGDATARGDSTLPPLSEASLWRPDWIVEYGCGAGEGLWAASQTWNSDEAAPRSAATPPRPIRYEGRDARKAMLRVASHLWAQHEAGEETEEAEEGSAWEPGQQSSSDDTRAALSRTVNATFKTPGGRIVSADADYEADHEVDADSSAEAEEVLGEEVPALEDSGVATESSAGSSSPGSGLVVSSFQLSSLSSDAARAAFVERLWRRHGEEAEAFAFVEAGDERGFACVASAREQMLALGRKASGEATETAQGTEAETLELGGTTFYAEPSPAPAEPATEARDCKLQPEKGCHVVLPCPHDRPCPLLHDFAPDEGTGEDGFRMRVRKQPPASRHPSFRGSALGLDVCAFPQRFHLPSFSRRFSESGGDFGEGRGGAGRGGSTHGATRYSFVVVRRGARRLMDSDGHEASELRRAAAARTKEGVVEALRRGGMMEGLPSSPVPPKPRVTLVTEEEQVFPAAQEASASEATSNSAGDAEDAAMAALAEGGDDGTEELLKLLPDALAREMRRAGAVTGDPDEATSVDEQQQAVIREALALAMGRRQHDEEARASSAGVDASDALPSLPAQSDAGPIVERISAQEEAAMRLESYAWPRLVAPPLKKGGHVTFDACAASGCIERYTLAKSAGRQVYHDARKASWGDAFPHGPRAGKGVEVRVPPATQQRVPTTAVERWWRAMGSRRGGGGPRAPSRTMLEQMTSWQAIGADRVAPRGLPKSGVPLTSEERSQSDEAAAAFGLMGGLFSGGGAGGASADATGSKAARVKAKVPRALRPFRDEGKRSHYRGSGASSKASAAKTSSMPSSAAEGVARETRKRSMGAFQDEIESEWTRP